MSQKENKEEDHIILDSNLLVYAFIDTENILSRKINEREKIYSRIAKYFFYETPTKILLPNFILDIELPRILSKLIIQKHITEETKLKILVNLPKQLKQLTHQLQLLEKFPQQVDTQYSLSIN